MNAAKRLFVLEEVACIRGQRLLFQNLSCGLDPGDVLHLSGPNGAGKTSLLRMMAGALPLAQGKMLWEGKDFLESGMEEHGRRFAFLPSDDRALKVLETCAENLSFWGRLRGTQSGTEMGALEKMGLQALENTPVRRLSAGQRRRLSLSRLLLQKTPLWLLDEPFNGLDVEAAGLFRGVLNAHVKDGGMAVIASHQQVEPPQGGALRRIELGAVGEKAA